MGARAHGACAAKVTLGGVGKVDGRTTDVISLKRSDDVTVKNLPSTSTGVIGKRDIVLHEQSGNCSK